MRGLPAILQLEPISYRWKQETGFDTENTYSGFSAQNVQEAIPEAVGEDEKGYLTLSDRPIVAALVNAVKELNARNEAVKMENATLKQELEGIKSTLSQLHAILQLPVGATPAIQSADVQYLDVFRSRVDEYLEGADENGRPVGSARPVELKEN